jgi:hypothetical protein
VTATATAPGGTGATDRAGGRRGFVVVGLVLVALVVVLVVAAPDRRSSGPPFDPSSTDPDGTRAAMELAERLGADVDVRSSIPDGSTDVVVVFEDVLDVDAAQRLQTWTEDGGRLVLADPYSAVTPIAEPVDVGIFDDVVTLDPDRCDLGSIGGAEAFEPVVSPVPAFRFEVEGAVRTCYGDGDRAALVAADAGAGTVVAFGAPRAFTNEYLDEEGNAGLFAALVVPEPGVRVAVLVPGDDGDELDPGEPGGLGDVLPDGALFAIAQLAVAFVVYALHRARRLGRPVPEDPPVEVAGSELVRAVGTMRQRAGERDRAAMSLRRSARLQLISRFGLPVESSPEAVAASVAARTGLDADRLSAALVDRSLPDEDALRALGAELDALVATALGQGRSPGPAVADPTAGSPPPPVGTAAPRPDPPAPDLPEDAP